MPIKEITGSKTFRTVSLTVGILLIALIIFAGGVFVGFRKARFSYAWGANYERNFMGPHRGPFGFPPDPEGHDFRNGHGVAGTILSISDNMMIVKDQDNKENTVAVTDKTIIKNGRDNLKIGDLKANDQIAVIGNPGDNGVINAELIRIFNSNPANN